MKKPPHPVKYIIHRKLRNLNMNQIKNDIMELNKKLDEITDQNELVSLYNNGLTNILDKHAPRKKMKIIVRNKTLWTSEEIRPEQNLKNQQNKYNALLREIRSNRLKADINENKVIQNVILNCW